MQGSRDLLYFWGLLRQLFHQVVFKGCITNGFLPFGWTLLDCYGSLRVGRCKYIRATSIVASPGPRCVPGTYYITQWLYTEWMNGGGQKREKGMIECRPCVWHYVWCVLRALVIIINNFHIARSNFSSSVSIFLSLSVAVPSSFSVFWHHSFLFFPLTSLTAFVPLFCL